MADTKEEIKNGYQKGKSEMNRLEIQIPERPIRIGVVGEYFTVMTPMQTSIFRKN